MLMPREIKGMKDRKILIPWEGTFQGLPLKSVLSGATWGNKCQSLKKVPHLKPSGSRGTF